MPLLVSVKTNSKYDALHQQHDFSEIDYFQVDGVNVHD
jgi:hypothetical protein